MSQATAERPSFVQLFSLVGNAVLEGDVEAKEVLLKGRKLTKMLAALLMLNIIGSCSITFFSGREVARMAATIQSQTDRVVAKAAVQMDPSMNPVRLAYSWRVLVDASYAYEVFVTNPAGEVVASAQGTLSLNKNYPRSEQSGTSSLGVVDIKQAGLHELRYELKAPRDKLRSVAFGPRAGGRSAPFMEVMLLIGVGAWFGQWWWRKQAEAWLAARHPVNDASGAVGSSAEPADLLPDSPHGPIQSWLQTRARPALGQRLVEQVLLWFLSLGVSVLWLPVAGVYFTFGLFCIAMLFQTAAPAGSGDVIKTAFESPTGQAALRYLVGEGGSYEGLAAANMMGTIAFKVLLPFHIMLVLARAVRRSDAEAPPSTLRQRYRHLVRWNLVLYAVMVVTALASFRNNPNPGFGEIVFGLAMLIGFTFAGAAIVLWIASWLETIIAKWRESHE